MPQYKIMLLAVPTDKPLHTQLEEKGLNRRLVYDGVQLDVPEFRTLYAAFGRTGDGRQGMSANTEAEVKAAIAGFRAAFTTNSRVTPYGWYCEFYDN
jgi:hypothetical protein